MSRKFTAEEMREMASVVLEDVYDDVYGSLYHLESKFDENTIAEMLRQSADELERERKYEYSIKAPNGNIEKCHEDEMFPIMPLICKVVRREVGEWKEVK